MYFRVAGRNWSYMKFVHNAEVPIHTYIHVHCPEHGSQVTGSQYNFQLAVGIVLDTHHWLNPDLTLLCLVPVLERASTVVLALSPLLCVSMMWSAWSLAAVATGHVTSVCAHVIPLGLGMCVTGSIVALPTAVCMGPAMTVSVHVHVCVYTVLNVCSLLFYYVVLLVNVISWFFLSQASVVVRMGGMETCAVKVG